jgi:predicted dehydrogenase
MSIARICFRNLSSFACTICIQLPSWDAGHEAGRIQRSSRRLAWLALDRRCGSGAVAPKIRSFASADEFFAAGRIADVLIIATQDSHHFEHAMSALDLGYDILLEKPAAESRERCEEIDRRARQLGQRVVPCFVLQYTPFYSTVKRSIDSGKLGPVISIRTHEGVEPFHQAHSFVRGHGSKTTDSTPMIVAKCSHDADLLC